MKDEISAENINLTNSSLIWQYFSCIYTKEKLKSMVWYIIDSFSVFYSDGSKILTLKKSEQAR